MEINTTLILYVIGILLMITGFYVAYSSLQHGTFFDRNRGEYLLFTVAGFFILALLTITYANSLNSQFNKKNADPYSQPNNRLILESDTPIRIIQRPNIYPSQE